VDKERERESIGQSAMIPDKKSMRQITVGGRIGAGRPFAVLYRWSTNISLHVCGVHEKRKQMYLFVGICIPIACM